MKLPVGFKAGGIAAGIKPSGRPDLAMIHSPLPLYWALASTENQLKAPCVQRNRARHQSGQTVHGVVVNAGNANCATGDQGIWDNEDFAGAAASALSLARVQDLLTASTGVVGKRLPIDKIRASLPDLVEELSDDSTAFAEAILTTDTRVKQVGATLRSGARVVGVAKGSGMIHPNMATMLAFVMTDAAVPQAALRELWQTVVARSFNQITVDGDTSPNDMAMLLCSHQRNAGTQELAEALDAVCRKLAQKVARDGEGATKLLTVEITGARTAREARLAARAVAVSPLVKSAVHGNDPNWGRILVAVGASGAVSDQSNLEITLQGTRVFRGTPMEFEEEAVSRAMEAEEVVIEVDLAAGDAKGTAWGCDLTAEYVRINADYTT